MGRVFTYVIFMTVLTIILQFAGFGTIGTAFANLIGFTPGVEGTVKTGLNLESTSLWSVLFGSGIGILILAATAGIAIGFVTKTASENYVILPFITGIATLFIDSLIAVLVNLSTYEAPWISALILIIYLPIGVGFIVTMVEWFRWNV